VNARKLLTATNWAAKVEGALPTVGIDALLLRIAVADAVDAAATAADAPSMAQDARRRRAITRRWRRTLE
jgi:hypothetical protein